MKEKPGSNRKKNTIIRSTVKCCGSVRQCVVLQQHTHTNTHTAVWCMSRDTKHSTPEEWVIDPSALGEAIFPSVRTGPECSAAPSCEKGRGLFWPV